MEKKLYKSSNDKVLSGVCGGVAEYFAVDPVIVRLIWVVFTMMGGAGLVVYIIAAIIMPDNPHGRTIEEDFTRTDEYKGETKQRSGRSTVALGIILLVFGGAIILKEYIPWVPRDFTLAAVVIGLGIYFLVRKK